MYLLCRGVDTLSYIILSVGLVSAFLLILTISAVINARATHKLCWATVIDTRPIYDNLVSMFLTCFRRRMAVLS